ncbi:ARM repeat-containing protein [Dentipellis sp. KUC8613]|nr:ARM repeat-containing protein [Dentipellis sp. KUC8613]
MEAAERLARIWVASQRDKEVEDTAAGIASGDIKLLHVVQALGEYLTSEEDDLRNKGVEFLAAVVSKCPPEKFSRQSVNVLVNFFTSKLEDTETIIPALKGLLGLTPLPSFNSEDAEKVVRALFAHVKMKALVQAQRYIVFSIIDSLMARHREALKKMGTEFISGYVNLADGEKDPRNLLVGFAISRVILVEFDVKSKIEDMFNITFCYFPITFKPPPDDPYGITSDDLKTALRNCLASTPLFGNLAIPLFLEKLNAGAPATKRDTLRTLSACLPVYGSAFARTSARKLWNSLKLEIFQPTDPITEEEALKTTQVLIKTIYADEHAADNHTETEATNEDTDIQGLAKDACEECIVILKEPEKSQAKPAIKVLCAFMSTTPSVSKYTLAQAVPHLIKLFLDPDERANRGPVLALLAALIAAARDSALSTGAEAAESPVPPPLLPYKDAVLGALTVGIKAPSAARPAIDGLDALVTTPGLLDDDELGFVVQSANEVITSDARDDADHADITDAALTLLHTIATPAPHHIASTTLPLLFAALPDSAPPRADTAARARYCSTLAALARLCTQPALFETLVVRILTKLEFLCVPSAAESEGAGKPGPAEGDVEPAAAYAHALLATLGDVLGAKVVRGDVDVPKYVDSLVPRLFNLFVYAAVAGAESESESGSVGTHPRVLGMAGRIVNLVVQTLDAKRQETFVAALFDAYLKSEVGNLAVGHQKVPAARRFKPFDTETNAGIRQKNLVTLFAQAVVALHKEVKLPVDDPTVFLTMLLDWSVHRAENVLERDSAWHVISAVLNKRAQDLETFVAEKLPMFWSSEIEDGSRPAEGRRLALSAWAWISKGLLLRSHPQALSLAERLFQLFDDAEVSWDAGRAIGQVVVLDKVLTKSNHAVIKILYAQKYMNAMLPRIVEGAKLIGEPRRQTAHLVALTSLITSIPKSTYAYELPTLIPLLLRGLELPDAEIRANVIETFLSAAQADVEANAKISKEGSLISGHSSTLVSTMLRNSSAQEMPNARVRIAALKYLAIIPQIVRYDVLHPHKPTVLKELTKALDDPKRAVRKEAVDARSNWYTYNG